MWNQYNDSLHIWQSVNCNILLTKQKNNRYEIEVSHISLSYTFKTKTTQKDLQSAKKYAIRYALQYLLQPYNELKETIDDLTPIANNNGEN